MESYDRTPSFEIEVRRPDYSKSQTYSDSQIAVFGASRTNGMSDACVGYGFSESVGTPSGSFSFSLVPERDAEGLTWYDKIASRDLVFIKENNRLRYVGVVRDLRYQARMGDRGPERVITISGGSIGDLLLSFSILIDLHILTASETNETAQKKLMVSLASNVATGQVLSGVVQTIKGAFFTMMENVGGNQNLGVKHVLDKYVDWTTRMSSSLVAQYPVVVSAFQMGENNLWSILQQVLNPPFHEMFGLLDPVTQKYEIWLRQAPFDALDWSKLPKTTIPDDVPALFLRDYDVGQSDQDVKTFFICTLPGSAVSKEKALTLDNYARSAVYDRAKWPYYGYRPMLVESRWFDRSEENQKGFSAERLMGELSQRLSDWYANNAGFLSGTISIMNVQNNDYPRYPRIGERLGFLGGEFYIESTSSSWQMGGSSVRTLSLSRGFMYTSSGQQDGEIKQVGPKIGVLEAKSDG